MSKRSLTWGILLLLLLVAAAVAHHAWQISKLSESTDNAQVEGDVVPLSAEVSGKVVEVAVSDNQVVKAGDLLVRIDPSDYQNHLEQAEKALVSAQQRERAARAQLLLTQRTAQALLGEQASGVEAAEAVVSTASSSVAVARQRLAQAQAGAEAARANLARTRTSVDLSRSEYRRVHDDLKRYQALYAKEEISRQQLEAIATQDEQARTRVVAAQREVQAAQASVWQAQAGVGQAQDAIETSLAQVSEAQSRVGEAESRFVSAQSAPDKIAVAEAQVKVAQADIEQAKVAVVQAKKDLERTSLRSPRDGVVSKKSAQVGAFTQRGTPLMALVSKENNWVVANFKETQMGHVRVGLKAEVSVDSYPGKVFAGHVESLQAGTGARFSLLPPENASGSYVKVVQRIPVKIVLDQAPSEDTPLLPGMSVVARVILP